MTSFLQSACQRCLGFRVSLNKGCLFPMIHPSLIGLLLFSSVLFMDDAAAQAMGNYDTTDQNEFQPSVAVVIIIPAIMFALTFVLLVYGKFCHRRVSAHGNHLLQGGRRISASSRFSGIDKTLIEALPFFRFSMLKGSKEGLECAVCLSKFEDIEVLRLLPKCKHAFHIDCIDHWLEKHSSCPLCRHKVSAEDLAFIAYSNSMRLLCESHSEWQEDSNIELFVEREEDHRSCGSSRFSIGSSFRKLEKGADDEVLIQEGGDVLEQKEEDGDKVLHKHKHRIVVSDFAFKNRWSNVSSSDLMFLSSEMLNTLSSNRFSSTSAQLSPREELTTGNEEITKIKEEMEMKSSFENKVSSTIMNKNTSTTTLAASKLPTQSTSHASSTMNQGEKRSMSEITGLSRFGNWGIKNRTKEPSLLDNNVNEERTRRLWLPIAKRTVQWFANREKRFHQQPQLSSTNV